MRISKLYFEDFLKILEENDIKVINDDETGKYRIYALGINICKWNGKIELMKRGGLNSMVKDERDACLSNLIKILAKTNQYYFEELSGGENE